MSHERSKSLEIGLLGISKSIMSHPVAAKLLFFTDPVVVKLLNFKAPIKLDEKDGIRACQNVTGLIALTKIHLFPLNDHFLAFS